MFVGMWECMRVCWSVYVCCSKSRKAGKAPIVILVVLFVCVKNLKENFCSSFSWRVFFPFFASVFCNFIGDNDVHDFDQIAMLTKRQTCRKLKRFSFWNCVNPFGSVETWTIDLSLSQKGEESWFSDGKWDFCNT